MNKSLLTITIISFSLLSNTLSFGMNNNSIIKLKLTVKPLGKSQAQPFEFEMLEKPLQMNIFAIVDPRVKNQLKNTSKAMNSIGAKKAPNMYELTAYDLNATKEDMAFIVFNAAYDKKTNVVENILKRFPRLKLIYEYPYSTSFVEIPRCLDLTQAPFFEKFLQETTAETIKSFNKMISENRSIRNIMIGQPSMLEYGCYLGRQEVILQELKELSTILQLDDSILMSALCIIIQKGDADSIELLSPYLTRKASGVDFLIIAMKKQKKNVFEVLAKNNVYGCLTYKELSLALGGKNTTTLDEISAETDIPNLDEYIAIYKKHGGKTLAEMGYDKHKEYNDITLSSHASMKEISSFRSCTIQ